MSCLSCGSWCCKDEAIFELGTAIDKRHDCEYLKEGRCSIYETRPLECRLFPWDVAEVDGHPYLIKWYPDKCLIDGIPLEVALSIIKANPEWVKQCLEIRHKQKFLNKYCGVKFAVISSI